MNKAKKLENIFNINKTTEKIPLNHSVIFDIDIYLKENKINRNKLTKQKNLLPMFEQNKSLNVSIKSISTVNHKKTQSLSAINMNINKNMNNSNSNKEIDLTSNVSKNKTISKIPFNKIGFSSCVLRDSGKHFILNDNPGIGHYETNDNQRFGIKLYFIYTFL
jgi:hypothetical protein